MRISKLLLRWVGLCLLAMPVIAQSEAQAPLKTVEEVLAAFVKANGGPENIEQVISLRAHGKVSREGAKDLEIVVLRKAPSRKRVSVYFEHFSHHRGFDGESSWTMVEQQNGSRQISLLEGEAKAHFEADLFHLDLLFYPSSGDLLHELIGVEYVGRVPCYVVRSTFKGVRRDSYIDSRTFRLPRIVEFVPGADGTESEALREFSDYTRIHQIWLARKIVQRTVEGEETTIHFEQVAVNEGIFDDVFEMPEARD